MINKQQQLYFQIINDLHANWQPHNGQLEAGKALISGKVDTLFLQCGRKFGKTEFAIYMLWRHALLNPGSACYYVTPEMTHGRKLVWTDPRLLNFGNSKYIKNINNNEMIVRFKNGSFIQILGSENFAAANGLRPSFLVYDEYCEFHPRFHETMAPNRAVFNCPLLIIGTPPLQDSRNKEQYISYAEECEKNKKGMWITKTSYENPHVDKEWLDEEKQRLFSRGEEYLWFSQYEAKLTAGGAHVIFPMLSDKHIIDHDKLMEEIRRDSHKLEWYCVSDPGTTTVMGFLFCAINPYSKKIYIMDEIYEKRPEFTSVQKVMPIVLSKAKRLSPSLGFDDDWIKVYDEAAAWFANEVLQQYGFGFQPTLKAHNKKENGISLIKDILIHNVVAISSNCKHLVKEMSNYVADEQGKIPKVNDHLIDCFRYFLAASYYSMVQIKEAVRKLGPRNVSDLIQEGDGVQKWDNPWAEDDWTSFAD